MSDDSIFDELERILEEENNIASKKMHMAVDAFIQDLVNKNPIEAHLTQDIVITNYDNQTHRGANAMDLFSKYPPISDISEAKSYDGSGRIAVKLKLLIDKTKTPCTAVFRVIKDNNNYKIRNLTIAFDVGVKKEEKPWWK
jgi:hypothetical protein